MKNKETLEEATKNYVDYCACNISEKEDLADADKRGFIEGAKWQMNKQERSYSEEEVLEMMRITRRNEDWTVSQLFEQFKKK